MSALAIADTAPGVAGRRRVPAHGSGLPGARRGAATTTSGIHLPEIKAALVYSRLAKRLRALGLQSFRDYVALVAQSGSGSEEREHLLMALTTNVTRFFREPHHFDHLIDDRAGAARRQA